MHNSPMDPLARTSSSSSGGVVASLESLTKDQLVVALKKAHLHLDGERRRSDGLQEELKQAKTLAVNVQKAVEMEEEAITNKLMKRLEQLKNQKAVLASEVEHEERFLTNNLQKRLEKLTLEKEALENKLEAEQEYIVNRLQKQLEQLAAEKNKLYREKVDLENQLEAEQEYILNKLQKQVDKLAGEKSGLAKEKSDLQRQITDLGASVERLNRDKVVLEQQMEMEEENIVNKLQRQLEGVLSNMRLIETRLEARGITLKDLGISSSDLCCSDWARIYSRSPSSTSTSIDRSTAVAHSMHMGHGSPTGGLGVLAGGALPRMLGSRRERPLSAQSTGTAELSARS